MTYSVTAIGTSAFYSCSGLTSIEIPNSVTTIGASAFYSCSGLTSIEIPNSVTTIGEYAFHSCSGLTSIEIPNSVTTISKSAFSSCSSLTSIGIPNSVTSIGQTAFFSCSSLTSIEIPNSVTSIGTSAFRSCTRLTSITLSDNITSIGDYTFDGCSGLTHITLPDAITSIGEKAFYECSGLMSLTLPESLMTIGDQAFMYNGVPVVTIPKYVTSIGKNAFGYCSNLKTVNFNSINCQDFSGPSYAVFQSSPVETINFGEDVTRIPAYFADNSTGTVKKLAIGNSVNTIGQSAFRNCTELTNVIIPNSVVTIADYAFSGCTDLTHMILPNSVSTIGDYAFFDCSGLRRVDIPNSVTSIGISAFASCTSLKTVNFNAVNCADFPSSSGYYVFNNCPIETIIIGDEVTRIPANMTRGCDNSSLSTLIIGNSVVTIGDDAFFEHHGLTTLSMPSSVKTIGQSAFYYCDNIKTVSITGDGEWTAGALPNNNGITTLYISSGMTLLSDMQVNPSDIYCYATIPPTCHSNSFSGYTGTLHVPASSFASYFLALIWENFTDIRTDAVEPTSISISQTTLEMIPEDEENLTATVLPANAVPNNITWRTSDPDVALVSNGVVTAIAPGECDIIASCFAVTAKCHVIVESDANTITLDQQEAMLLPNHVLTLIPSTPVEPEAYVASSSDPAVAAARVMNGQVLVVGIKEGTTTITVGSSDGLAVPATCIVTVYTEPGDVNMDGFVNISDVTRLINYLLTNDPTGIKVGNADADNDGLVNIKDVTTLINQLLTASD